MAYSFVILKYWCNHLTKNMKNKFKNIFGKYKVLVLVTTLVVSVTVGVFIVSKVSAKSNPNIEIKVVPTLSLGPCYNNQKPPKAAIVAPPENSKYTTGDKVSLTGVAVLECNNSKLEDSDLAWYLDSDTTPFAKGYAFTLENLKTGDHKIKLTATSGNLKTDVFVNIKVVDAQVQQVLGIQAPVEVIVPKDTIPPIISALITQLGLRVPQVLKEGAVVSISDLVDEVGNILTKGSLQLSLKGSAQDNVDSNVANENFEWTMNGDPAGKGSSVDFVFYPKCGLNIVPITLKVKDSAGNSVSTTTNISITYTSTTCLLQVDTRSLEILK